ncbi:MAG TPA: GGDEF domain-containing protein [Acidimicrobiales bacterium]
MALAGFVAVVAFLDSTGVLSPDAEVVVDDSAQLAAGLLAATLCWWSARRLDGIERRWRLLMAVGMFGWSVGQAFWSYYQIFSDTPLPSPSVADVGYLMMPVFALPALLAFEVKPSRETVPVLRPGRIGILLDGAIVVGALFILTWATALGAVVRTETPDAASFAVAIAYPLTDLILVAIVGLLVVTRRVPAHLRQQLSLLGWGVVAISVSDSIFAYLVSSGAEEMPPLTNVGFIAGPLLIAVAAVTTSERSPAARHMRRRVSIDRAHLLLPHALVALTGSVITVQMAVGTKIDPVEAVGTWVVVIIVLVRQVIAMVENATLLERLSAAQAELTYRADHDPLTGLANRALFDTRLDQAIDRYHATGGSLAVVVVDLDDFKEVNDTLGHTVGDQLLLAVGERLQRCVRSGDTVARLGGDEFAIILAGDSHAPGIVAERILASLHQSFRVGGNVIVLGASLGVVEPRPGETQVTADVLVHRADKAMYAGKRRGKGIAVHYGPDLGRVRMTTPPATRPRGPVVLPAAPAEGPWPAGLIR